jgi:hypothetical protein
MPANKTLFLMQWRGEFQGWDFNATHELDVTMQHDTEILVEAMYKMDHAAAQDYEMEWREIGMENSDTNEGWNNGEDATEGDFETHMEWRTIEFESCEIYVAQNICEVVPDKLFDGTGLEDEMRYMEWSDIETGEVG